MKSYDPRDNGHCRHDHPTSGRVHGFLRRWFLANSLVSGVFALAWLLLRSGSKPSRFAYPCQQMAVSAATLAFGAPVVSAVIAARRRLARGVRSPVGLVTAGLGLVISFGTWAYLSRASERGPHLEPRAAYRAGVYHVTDCPQSPIGDRFVGIDNLITLMGREGLKFYASSTSSPVAGPRGLIAADDVVVVKINYQWDERGGTNVDLLRGLIRRVVDHPDGFVGEVVVCENSQFNPIGNFDRPNTNSQDQVLSPHDVVVLFQGQGHTISHYDWTVRRYTAVGEYSDGDMADGYVVYGYDPTIQGAVSYPKFQTSYGTYVSVRSGIWDPGLSDYDRKGLKFINVPVLKSHNATYGATACVKNYMGVVTGALGTNSHAGIGYGLLGAVLGEIGLADLNVLDCIWINANPFDGPWTSYAGATRRDEIVASTDPVAADMWAVTNILIPAFIANGYSPPWPYPSADPANPNSQFRTYLDNSMDEILAVGLDATNDLGQIDAVTWNGAGDFDGDSDVDAPDYAYLGPCLSGPGIALVPGCEAPDLDRDGDVDLDDFAEFQTLFTGSIAYP